MRTAIAPTLLLAGLFSGPGVGHGAGVLDPAFGGGGTVLTDAGTGDDEAVSVVVQPDGKTIAFGHRGFFPNRDFVFARYEADGTLDPSFGSGGIAIVDAGTGEFPARALLQPDGKIVGSGAVNAGAVLVRLEADGSLDPGFGTGGIVGPLPTLGISAIALDGAKIVTAGTTIGPPFDLAIARFLPNGSADGAFGVGGLVSVDVTPTSLEQLRGVAVQSDGKIVAAGNTYPDGGCCVNSSLVAVRVTSTGVLDTSYGSGGVFVQSFGSGTEEYRDAVLQGDGKLVVGGFIAGPTSTDFHVVRLLSSGLLDTGYGAGGHVVTDLNGSFDHGLGLALDADDRVVQVGWSDPNDFGIVRYLENGALDPSFGTGGKVRTLVGSNGVAYAVARGPDGRLVVAGWADDPDLGSTDFGLARYLNNSCGDGSPESGEQCDDGNLLDGDCCSNQCQFEPIGSPCAEDGLVCTTDTCNGVGQCVHPAQVLSGCKQSVVPYKGQLSLVDKSPDARDRIAWTWGAGEATTIVDFGNPLVATAYTLCGIDTSSASPALLFEIDAPAGGVCAGRSCWGLSGTTGFKYNDRDLTPTGAAVVVLKSGPGGKAKAIVRGKGSNLTLPATPLDIPARVQLRASNGLCVESHFSAAGIRKNVAGAFKAKSN